MRDSKEIPTGIPMLLRSSMLLISKTRELLTLTWGSGDMAGRGIDLMLTQAKRNPGHYIGQGLLLPSGPSN